MIAPRRAPGRGTGHRAAHSTLIGWLLAAAYVPALTFFGHWPLSIDIPGTAWYVGLPETRSPHEQSHKDHCHADAASCSDAPVAAGATVGLLAESLEIATGETGVAAITQDMRVWLAQAGVAPVSPPPEAGGRG